MTRSGCSTTTGWHAEPFANSQPERIGPITLDAKPTGKPSAGNLHAGFDAPGAGNQLTIRLLRHSQRKRGATDRLSLRSLAPVLDPTDDHRCRLSPDFPQIAFLIEETGEYDEQRLNHEGGE